MSFANKSLSVIGKLAVVLLLLTAFSVGLGGVLYTALRSPEVQVPEIVGKDYLAGEKELVSLDLKIRKRTDRFSQETPNTILEQTPRAGEMVKAGQTISVVISRAEAEGDEKPAEVKKETVNDKPKEIDEPSEVDKARQKRKAANANKNVNGNKNANGNANSDASINSNTASNGNNANGSNSNSGGSNNNSNARSNSNSRSGSNSATNLSNRPATSGAANRSPATGANTRSAPNNNRRP